EAPPGALPDARLPAASGQGARRAPELDHPPVRRLALPARLQAPGVQQAPFL
ncbi:MAG: hypothetical protein AVDCRST_MAG77-4028, partial [uncultured Chloroflexi bacterium]